jgi:hypothetical protein
VICGCRSTPDKFGLDNVAAKLKDLNIHGLLMIGGFEVILEVSQSAKHVAVLLGKSCVHHLTNGHQLCTV